MQFALEHFRDDPLHFFWQYIWKSGTRVGCKKNSLNWSVYFYFILSTVSSMIDCSLGVLQVYKDSPTKESCPKEVIQVLLLMNFGAFLSHP